MNYKNLSFIISYIYIIIKVSSIPIDEESKSISLENDSDDELNDSVVEDDIFIGEDVQMVDIFSDDDNLVIEDTNTNDENEVI